MFADVTAMAKCDHCYNEDVLVNGAGDAVVPYVNSEYVNSEAETP